MPNYINPPKDKGYIRIGISIDVNDLVDKNDKIDLKRPIEIDLEDGRLNLSFYILKG